MNCTFIAYPAELEPKNVLKVLENQLAGKMEREVLSGGELKRKTTLLSQIKSSQIYL